MTTLPLTDHPIVRAAAEEMARDLQREWTTEHGDFMACLATLADPFAVLLCNLSRPASRDWWVRWGSRLSVEPVNAAARRWHALRDDPDALAAAILAALSETPDAR